MNHEWINVYQYWKKTGMVVEEETMFQYVQQRYPNWISHYHHCLRRARQAVLKKLVAAFLRENIGGIVNHLHKELPCEAHPPFPPSYRFYPVQNDQWLIVPIGKRYAFDRYQLTGDLLLHTATSLRPIEHVVEWLILVYPLLSKQVKRAHWGRLVEELCNAGANQSLSYLWQEIKKGEIRQQENAAHLIEFVQKRNQEDPLFFEQFCVEGHHLHPCAKTKLGLSPEEVDRNSPECRNQPSLHFVAVRPDFVRSTWVEKEQEPNSFIFEIFPGLESQIDPVYREQYQLIPVHGWQMERVIPTLYQEEIAKKIIVPLPNVKIPALATSSFRTLCPVMKSGYPSPITVKVAVNSQMTSTVRSISPQTTMNAKKFTLLMQEVMRREPQLRGKFVPIGEIGGCYFKSIDPLKRRNLSVVFREAMPLQKDETPIVASALYDRSPLTGQPIIADLLRLYAENKTIQSEQKAADQFITEYIDLTLTGYLTLMVKYGIGLEGHMQNSIPVFRQGRPIKMMVRDWGGARIYRERLQKQGMRLDFDPNSLTVTTKIEKMHEKMFYTVYQSHLGELIIQLCNQYRLSEDSLWKKVGEISRQILEQIAQNPLFTDQSSQDQAFLFQNQVPLKALTMMRLFPDKEQYCQVANPLCYQNSCSPT